MTNYAPQQATSVCRERMYGIDLLKTMAMIMVVTLHVLGHGGVLAACTAGSPVQRMAILVEATCIIAVNLFVLATGYLGYGSSHRPARVIVLWFQMLFWSLLIAVAFNTLHLVPRSEIPFRELATPVLSKENWYLSTYFGLFLFMPLLDRGVRALSPGSLASFALAGLAAFSLLGNSSPYDPFSIGRGYSLIWFVFLYCMGAICRRLDLPHRSRSARTRILLLATCLACTYATFRLGCEAGLADPGAVVSCKHFNYSAPLVFLAATSLFLLVSSLRITFIPLQSVLALASGTLLDVYLIHEHLLIRSAFISNRFTAIAELTPIDGLLRLAAGVGTVFGICLCLGSIRILLFRLLHIKQLSEATAGLLDRTIRVIGRTSARLFPRNPCE